ncbi:MAG: hypothetical protein JO185_26390 [Acidobacteriaceae bacterium]|nr:hypothetical protein [Acidobacteriaceae bacterium]
MNKLNICLTEWQTRIILEALNELEKKWQHINQTTQDEDEQADYANDLVELSMTKRHVTEAAVQVFSRSVTNFDRTFV